MKYLSLTELKRSLKAMLTLEIILEPKKWLRLNRFFQEEVYHKFFIDDDNGNSLTIVIAMDRALIKGFEADNELNQFEAAEWDPTVIQRIYKGAPKDLLNDNERDETTFCIWYSAYTDTWTQNEIDGNDGGSARLLSRIYSTPEAWSEWASGYYHLSPNMDAVRDIYSGKAVTADTILSLNPDRDAAEALQEIEALDF